MTARSSRSHGCQRWLVRGAIILLCIVGFGITFWLYEDIETTPASPTPAPSQQTALRSGLIKVFFTTPTLIYPDRRPTRPASPLLEAVLADLDDAESSISVASFDFDVDQIATGLVAAHKRGVDVRLVVDRENVDGPETASAVGRVQDAGIPVSFDEREAFMHDKFVVIDKRIVWTGSWNLTYNDTFRNNNNAVRLRSRLAAESYTAEFDQMFAGVFGPSKVGSAPHPQIILDETPIDMYFAPKDGVASHILEYIANARTSIRVLAFSFTSSDIADALIDRSRAGVKVQGVFERQNASGVGASFQAIKRAGLDVFEDGNCYILHHKTIIIDNHIVITGSYNFTRSAERSNDENLIIIDDREVAQLYVAEFERLYRQAQSPTRCGQ